MMHGPTQSLFTRDDTFLGVCEGIGQDLGFNPNYLRVALGVLILWNPTVVLGAYLALGLLVAVTRWIYPSRPAAARTQAHPVPAGVERALAAGNDEDVGILAIAA
jgi:phage shock protein PspC (stress-responsive transcriptional regulator)